MEGICCRLHLYFSLFLSLNRTGFFFKSWNRVQLGNRTECYVSRRNSNIFFDIMCKCQCQCQSWIILLIVTMSAFFPVHDLGVSVYLSSLLWWWWWCRLSIAHNNVFSKVLPLVLCCNGVFGLIHCVCTMQSLYIYPLLSLLISFGRQWPPSLHLIAALCSAPTDHI